MSLEKVKHFPVLLEQTLNMITPQHGGTFIDCTFGAGGYSEAILKYPNTKVIAFDRDTSVKEFSEILKKKYGENRFKFYFKKFSCLGSCIKKDTSIKAIIFDLGFSLMQIKNLKRGFSFDSKTELDMRMGINKFSASDVINKLDQDQISTILKYFGDEKDHKKIAFQLIKLRKNKKNINTSDFVNVINTMYDILMQSAYSFSLALQAACI